MKVLEPSKPINNDNKEIIDFLDEIKEVEQPKSVNKEMPKQ